MDDFCETKADTTLCEPIDSHVNILKSYKFMRFLFCNSLYNELQDQNHKKKKKGSGFNIRNLVFLMILIL